MKWLRRAVLALFLLGMVVVLALSFRPKPVPVETAKIERGEFVETVDEPAKTRVRERFVISAPVAGELARIELSAGDAVSEGAVLATIRPLAPQMLDVRTKSELEARVKAAQASQALAAAAVDKARAGEAFAKKEVDRISALVEKGTLAGVELDEAQHALTLAQKDVKSATLSAHVAANELAVAKAALASGGKADGVWEVKSPLKGRVLKVLRESSGVVQAGTPLLEVADPTDLEVVAALLTSDAIRVRVGARVTLERWGGDAPLHGVVRTIEPSGYTKLSALGVEEQRVDVVIDIASPAETWAQLGDGYRVHSRTEVFRTADAVKSPSAALFRDGEQWAVFAIEGGRALKKVVSVERRNGPEAMISGVEPGTVVVAFPSNAVGDGVKVAVR